MDDKKSINFFDGVFAVKEITKKTDAKGNEVAVILQLDNNHDLAGSLINGQKIVLSSYETKIRR